MPVNSLTLDRTPRVWSLLVTVFGELAQDRDARISGSLLRHFSDHIGIKPEAMRVALHRLRKDGWIESIRIGRTNNHVLTSWGREQSITASPRIYAKGAAATHAWLVMFNPAQSAPQSGPSDAWITSNLLVTSVRTDHGDAIATALGEDDALPDWLTSKICDPATIALSGRFLKALNDLQMGLHAAPELTPMQIAALRVLVVHGWRRIVLKAPELPDYVFPAGWCGLECRAATSTLLDQLPKQDLADLEQGLISDTSH